jgi:twinkle protein
MNPNISVVTAFDLSTSIVRGYEKEDLPGVSTGWQSLDRYYTVVPGQLTIVTGVPSHGKSEFVDALCMNLAMKHTWRILYYSPENYPVETHVKNLMRKYIGKPYGMMYNGTMTPDEAEDALQFVESMFGFIYPGEYLITVDDILDIAKTWDIDGLVIDPWNELDHRRPAGMREDEYISMSLGKIRTASRAMDVHTWLVAHPKLPPPGRNYKTSPPGLYDVSGGAHWYNKADNGITIHRPDVVDGSDTNVHITKVRFRNIGKPTGETPVSLNYHMASGRYNDA